MAGTRVAHDHDVRWGLFVIAVTACYSPDLEDCITACATAEDCAPSQLCGNDGLCASEPVAGRCSSLDTVDAGTEDAPDLCATACIDAAGTCQGGRCVIDMPGPGDVTCPSGMPCTVLCNAKDACKEGVRCGGATSCIVECAAESACKDRGVDCGSATTCEVLSRGASACQHGSDGNKSVECRAADCTVTCDGNAACQDGIEVYPQGSCNSSCCQDACEGGTSTCVNDNVCT